MRDFSGGRVRQNAIDESVVGKPFDAVFPDRPHFVTALQGLFDCGEDVTLIFRREVFDPRSQCQKQVAEEKISLVRTQFENFLILLAPLRIVDRFTVHLVEEEARNRIPVRRDRTSRELPSRTVTAPVLHRVKRLHLPRSDAGQHGQLRGAERPGAFAALAFKKRLAVTAEEVESVEMPRVITLEAMSSAGNHIHKDVIVRIFADQVVVVEKVASPVVIPGRVIHHEKIFRFRLAAEVTQ